MNEKKRNNFFSTDSFNKHNIKCLHSSSLMAKKDILRTRDFFFLFFLFHPSLNFKHYWMRKKNVLQGQFMRSGISKTIKN